MREETIQLMCNPYCGEPFKRRGETLIGVTSGKEYPIRNGIPVILGSTNNRRQTWYSQLAHQILAFGYDPILQLGEKLRINTEKIVRQRVIQGLEVKSGYKVLETAIGSGANLPFVPSNGDYYGIDLSYPLLRMAQKKFAASHPNLELIQADGAYVPFRDDSFDLVFHMGGIQFYADPFRGVSEMARVARPGTTVTVIDELSGAIRTLSRLPAHRRYSTTEEKALEGLLHLVPHSMQEKECRLIPDTDFYLLTFKKPEILITHQF